MPIFDFLGCMIMAIVLPIYIIIAIWLYNLVVKMFNVPSWILDISIFLIPFAVVGIGILATQTTTQIMNWITSLPSEEDEKTSDNKRDGI